jgi:hypothetical protein
VVSLPDGSFGRVCFDGRALLGPESTQAVTGGLSEVAAKSSYTSVLMRSAIESAHSVHDPHRRADLQREGRGPAVP